MYTFGREYGAKLKAGRNESLESFIAGDQKATSGKLHCRKLDPTVEFFGGDCLFMTSYE